MYGSINFNILCEKKEASFKLTALIFSLTPTVFFVCANDTIDIMCFANLRLSKNELNNETLSVPFSPLNPLISKHIHIATSSRNARNFILKHNPIMGLNGLWAIS